MAVAEGDAVILLQDVVDVNPEIARKYPAGMAGYVLEAPFNDPDNEDIGQISCT